MSALAVCGSFPTVGPERNRRQASVIAEIRIFRVVVEGVPDRHRVGHFIRANDHLVLTLDPGLGPMPFPVSAGNSEFRGVSTRFMRQAGRGKIEFKRENIDDSNKASPLRESFSKTYATASASG